MKKIHYIFTLLVVALAGLSLTACSNDDLSTNQYSDGVALGAFGPSPVLRGGTLFFYGSNLDQVKEIILPGQTSPVTDITVLESGTHSKISITVPAEGGTEGQVTLKTGTGLELVSSSKLTFREDISISKVYIGTEGNLNGEVGSVLTIEGDYLNLMWGVIFNGGYTVTDLIEHTRYKLSVKIPKEAASGKIILTNLAELPTELEANDEITIKLPEVPTPVAANQKAGSSMTITGIALDQIQTVQLAGGVTIAEEDITRAADGTSLSFAIPAAAKDGDITLVTYSGQKIAAGTLTTVAPSGLAVAGTVKNGLAMTVTGTDMDLVKSVSFANAGAYDGNLDVAADKVIIAKVPEKAQDGNLTLTMENGKEVTVAYTLVKPTVTSADPASITAGEETVIYGTNLDLVAAIIFPGEAEQTVEAKNFAAQEADGIQVTVPSAASGSGFKLTLKNDTEVAISGILTIKPASDPAISEAPAQAVAGDVITIKGKNFNNLANLYVGTYKVTRYSSKSNTEITFKVPEAPVGDYKFVMEDYDGNKYDGPAFAIVSPEKDITTCCLKMDDTTPAAFPVTLAWGGDGQFWIMRDRKPEIQSMNLVAGQSKMIFYFDNYDGQLQFNNPNWTALFTLASWDADAGAVREVIMTQDMVDWCLGTQKDQWGTERAFVIQGSGPVLRKITIIP